MPLTPLAGPFQGQRAAAAAHVQVVAGDGDGLHQAPDAGLDAPPRGGEGLAEVVVELAVQFKQFVGGFWLHAYMITSLLKEAKYILGVRFFFGGGEGGYSHTEYQNL